MVADPGISQESLEWGALELTVPPMLGRYWIAS